MDFDLDPFADTIPERASSNARAGGKFQPKSKARPKQETPSTLPTNLSSATEEKSAKTTSGHDAAAVKPITPATNLQDAVKSLSPVDPGQSGSIDSIHVSSFSVNTSIIRQCVKAVENPSSKLIGAEVLANKTETPCSGVQLSDGDRSFETGCSLSEVTISKENAGSTNARFSETAISNSNMNIHSGFGKLGVEGGDIFFELESLDNILFQANTSTVVTENNFQCNSDVSSQPGSKLIISHPVTNNAVDSNISLREQIFHSSSHQYTEVEQCSQVLSSVNSSTFLQCNANAIGVPAESILSHEPVNSSKAAACDSSRHMQIDNLRPGIEEAGAFNGLETFDVISEATVAPVNHNGEFWSKSKAQDENERPITSFSFPDAMESISCPGDAQLTPQIYLDESSVPTFRPDCSLDFSTMRFSETTPSDRPPELLVTEGPRNLVEASHSDVVTSEKVMDSQASGGTSRRGTRKKKQSIVLEGTVKEGDSQNFEQPSQRGQDQRPASMAVDENEATKLSRRLRKRIAVCVPADERENGIGESENVHEETSNCSDMEEGEEDGDDEYRVKDTSRKRRAPRKMKKHAPENDGPVQKHKKVSEGQGPSEKKVKKRFSHSTKRKRRLVDKVLLETPEDEINPQKLMIRDLILLAEAKEKLSNKEAAASKKSFPNRSAVNSAPYDASYNEDDSFASTQDYNSADDQATQHVQRSSTKLNYHTFMDRTPSERWSKQDTELFYEAIRQFGTDFAMIQQLFPGRTRHQVKLKYKKEERQHPLRLSDALTNRSKDHSHFQIVIQRLQAAAQAEKNSDGDVASVAMTDEEEVTREENEEVAKSDEKVEQVAKSDDKVEQVANNPELKVPEVRDIAVSLDNEDDFWRWSQYRGADYSSPEDEEKGEYDL
ncbi:uncharacterized protein LOC122077031 [Macadamia integrifolia]|uniref:uncharacterized protein LOC122077031 n=1 Tax=Macadamia integrifolia TaxID=60698 RepID=UPI001C4F5E54|nr:uncharacterized protein LOC122077031 [Macadamia integrifolia]XP_042498701.1 uncharacterized protein LOC122077031 [Macadamia integrifolia]XP_042498702.1 uncharacterized protein LOC122077031 [Macadamia integrifolia]XP_042498703.1 uncharacterized protein LOC122077031 [Macadamia integrifolia]XP_042498704.1 uncharacterized protein LOC122077031 [Macadamia integrifolia]